MFTLALGGGTLLSWPNVAFFSWNYRVTGPIIWLNIPHCLFFFFEGNWCGLYLGVLQHRFVPINALFWLLLDLRCIVVNPCFVDCYEIKQRFLYHPNMRSQSHWSYLNNFLPTTPCVSIQSPHASQWSPDKTASSILVDGCWQFSLDGLTILSFFCCCVDAFAYQA